MSQHLSNEAIVHQLKYEGFDEQLFEELFYRFVPLYHKLKKQIRIADFEKDDYYQEARISLYQAINHYHPHQKSYFSSFFLTVYRNNLINHLRRQLSQKNLSNHDTLSLDLTADHLDENHSGYNLADILNKNQEPIENQFFAKENFANFLQSLSSFERQVLYHRMIQEDNSSGHIAQVLGIKKRSVENALARCWKKSKDYLY